jgi:hypothetical protein
MRSIGVVPDGLSPRDQQLREHRTPAAAAQRERHTFLQCPRRAQHPELGDCRHARILAVGQPAVDMEGHAGHPGRRSRRVP